MGLVWLLREHGDALEADFQRYYGIDLIDLYRGTLSPRKASVLALYLPPGAAVWQEAGTDSAWDTTDYLLAEVVDTLKWANYQRAGGKGQKPEPLPRPAQLREIREKRRKAFDRAAAFRERHRLRRETRKG